VPIDSQYWLLRRHPHQFGDLEKISKLRRKLLRSVNKSTNSGEKLSDFKFSLSDKSLQSPTTIKERLIILSIDLLFSTYRRQRRLASTSFVLGFVLFTENISFSDKLADI